MQNRGSKVLTIVALCIAVAGLTLGFAAFSRNLTINSTAQVTPDDSAFGVIFVADKNDEEVLTISEIAKSDGANAGNPVIASDGKEITIANLTATLPATGDYVEYTFYVKNTGSFPAILKSMSLGQGRKTCTAKEINGTAASTGLYGACNSVNVSVSVDEASIATTTGTTTLEAATLVGGAAATMTGTATVPVSGYSTVKVRLSYDGTGVADGDFEVVFDTVTLNFQSA